jgi:hypothetical protein
MNSVSDDDLVVITTETWLAYALRVGALLSIIFVPAFLVSSFMKYLGPPNARSTDWMRFFLILNCSAFGAPVLLIWATNCGKWVLDKDAISFFPNGGRAAAPPIRLEWREVVAILSESRRIVLCAADKKGELMIPSAWIAPRRQVDAGWQRIVSHLDGAFKLSSAAPWKQPLRSHVHMVRRVLWLGFLTLAADVAVPLSIFAVSQLPWTVSNSQQRLLITLPIVVIWTFLYFFWRYQAGFFRGRFDAERGWRVRTPLPHY